MSIEDYGGLPALSNESMGTKMEIRCQSRMPMWGRNYHSNYDVYGLKRDNVSIWWG